MGDARRQHQPTAAAPRAESTIYSQLDFAFPTLRTWARDHQSLREIGREEFLAVLAASGTARATLITSCRSIFKILKGRKVVFTDPTHGITGVTQDVYMGRGVACAEAARVL